MSFSPATGRVNWSVPYKVTYGVSIATPIFQEGLVVVCGYWEGSKAIRLGNRPAAAELAWEENRFLRGIMSQPLYRDGLVSEAMEKIDQEEQTRLAEKMEKGQFTLDDFMSQMGQVKKLGPMSKVMGMIPGMSEMAKTSNMGEGDVDKQMGRMRAIYDSMSRKERKNPDVLDAYLGA